MSKHELSAWSKNRPELDESTRRKNVDRYSSHLPTVMGRTISEDDINAMKAAYICRFNEDLPRTETLFAVAQIGYRMAIRDMQKVNS